MGYSYLRNTKGRYYQGGLILSLETINNTLLTIAAHLKEIEAHLKNLDRIEVQLRTIAAEMYHDEGDD